MTVEAGWLPRPEYYRYLYPENDIFHELLSFHVVVRFSEINVISSNYTITYNWSLHDIIVFTTKAECRAVHGSELLVNRKNDKAQKCCTLKLTRKFSQESEFSLFVKCEKILVIPTFEIGSVFLILAIDDLKIENTLHSLLPGRLAHCWARLIGLNESTYENSLIIAGPERLHGHPQALNSIAQYRIWHKSFAFQSNDVGKNRKRFTIIIL